MRSLPLAVLLLTAGFAATPGAAATDCGGLVDVDCGSTYCTDYTPDGCFHREAVHCILYVDPTRVTGTDENQATVVCYLVPVAPAESGSPAPPS